MKHRMMTAFLLSCLASCLLSGTALAGSWAYNDMNASWHYQNDDGSLAKGWNWIDGLCYYFDEDGRMYADTVTPDGYSVDRNGAWTVNGILQRQGEPVATNRTVTPYFTYIEPDSWKGKTSWQVWEANAVTLYDDANRHYGGHLFTVLVRDTFVSPDSFPDFGEITYLGCCRDFYTGAYSYFYTAGPTDVPYDYTDPVLAAEYQSLLDASGEMLQSITGSHGEPLT